MTRTIATIFVTTVAVIGSAFAADMTTDELKAFISGNTTYLQTTALSATSTPGQGIIYFAQDGVALYKTPSGAVWHGKWVTKDNSLCVDWKERPNNACVKYVKNGDKVTVVTAASGEMRATVMKTAPGNAEKIAP
jgi:hypothetical protein